MQITPRIGDIIGLKRHGYVHVCVYIGPRLFDGRDVIHNVKDGVVEFTTLRDFAGDAQIFIHKPASPDCQPRAVIARAVELIGTRYDLFSFNCEHAANYVQTGQAESPQLQGLFFVAACLGIFFAVRRV